MLDIKQLQKNLNNENFNFNEAIEEINNTLKIYMDKMSKEISKITNTYISQIKKLNNQIGDNFILSSEEELIVDDSFKNFFMNKYPINNFEDLNKSLNDFINLKTNKNKINPYKIFFNVIMIIIYIILNIISSSSTPIVNIEEIKINNYIETNGDN